MCKINHGVAVIYRKSVSIHSNVALLYQIYVVFNCPSIILAMHYTCVLPECILLNKLCTLRTWQRGLPIYLPLLLCQKAIETSITFWTGPITFLSLTNLLLIFHLSLKWQNHHQKNIFEQNAESSNIESGFNSLSPVRKALCEHSGVRVNNLW